MNCIDCNKEIEQTCHNKKRCDECGQARIKTRALDRWQVEKRIIDLEANYKALELEISRLKAQLIAR